MMEFLSNNLKIALKNLNLYLLYEIRVRAGQPTRVNYGGKYEFLGTEGIVHCKEKALICSKKEIEDMVYSAGEFSVYAVEEQIRRGFITAKEGVRIGLVGEYIFSKGQPLTIRNISSLCIRVPHKLVGCSNEIYQSCCINGVKNLLLLSPPGLGKTTILKDLITTISNKTLKNVLICDERGELCDDEIGPTCDRIAYASKSVAFEAGLRAMRPDIVVTDEITNDDLVSIKKMISSGVIVIATAHLNSIENVKNNGMDLFDYYVVLDEYTIGKLKFIYNKTGECLFNAC